MSPLRQALADYLTMRRALGYKLDKTERLLGQFVSFAEVGRLSGPKRRWPGRRAPSGAEAIWFSRRLAEVRLFARHLHGIDPKTEVPPADLLPARTRRATPYLYTSQEISGPDAGHDDPARIARAVDVPDADRDTGSNRHACR